MPACLSCKEEYQPGPRRGARPQAYCTPKCQQTAANQRRASTRSGRGAGALRTPKSILESPESPSTIHTPPEAPNPVDRLDELMDKAHSKTGIGAFEVAELARLRGLSPWTPFRLIVSKDYQPR
jgi:hypothetical protein